MGFTLNLLTLLAIVLSVGLVVDDAIVVVENVSRHMRAGMCRVEAALISSRELFGPIVAMTITLVAVYAPIGFQGGLTGVAVQGVRLHAGVRGDRVGDRGRHAVADDERLQSTAGGHEGRPTPLVNRHASTAVRRGTARARRRARTALGHRGRGAVRERARGLAALQFSRKELAPVEDQGFIFLIVNSAPDASLAGTRRRQRSRSTRSGPRCPRRAHVR